MLGPGYHKLVPSISDYTFEKHVVNIAFGVFEVSKNSDAFSIQLPPTILFLPLRRIALVYGSR